MKKILAILFSALMAMSFAMATQTSDIKYLSGDCTAITSGWAEPATSGNYGGAPLDSFCMVVDKDYCGEDTTAEIDLDFGVGDNTVCLKHLDGLAGDSFDLEIKVGDVYIGTYTDDSSSEVWKETCFNYNSANGGTETVVVTSLDNPWDLCSTYGQLAIKWISVDWGSSDVPEFGIIGALIALSGAGFVMYRKRK